jgi:hypothetical protein
MKEQSNYLKHSNHTHLSLCSISVVTTHPFISILTRTGNAIGDEGTIHLAEALKSNSSLATLYIYGNNLVASFHSHSIQITRLAPKEEPNYLKHSNQIPLSLYSISTVMYLLLLFRSHSIQKIRLVLKQE